MTAGHDSLTADAKRRVFLNREFPFTYRDFQQIAAIMLTDAGIALPDVKAPLVYSRLVKRLRMLGVESFRRYCKLLEEGDKTERERMVAALTTNVTRFFREPHHFEHFKTKVLLPSVARIRKGDRLRVWCAGCSTGEEAYSLALSILTVLPDAPKYDIKVLATDISTDCLEAGRRGVFQESVIAPVSRQMRANWFGPARATDGTAVWRAGEALRQLVAFRELNLMDAWPMRRPFQAVFCRNVAIYFEPEIQDRLWGRLAEQLAPAGYLYIGHSERIGQKTLPLAPDGNTVYRRGPEQYP